ncbi:MAG: hypothetical protein ACPHKJ_02860, partial [Litorivicinaceae bacterium]
THQVFRLADSVRVTVARVDLDARRIDFALAGDGLVGRPRRVSVRSRLKDGNIPGKSQSRGRSKKSGKRRR